MTNLEIAELLRRVAAAYQILGENRFKIIAYERAATSIEHLTSDLKDYWDDKKLSDVPGVGPSIAQHLDELFRTGHAKHFDAVMGKLPGAVYPLLRIPGVGPRKAYRIVRALHLTGEKTVIRDVERAIAKGKIAPIEGFGEKSQADIAANIATYKKGAIKENRMSLPVADGIARDVMNYMKKNPAVRRIDALGSLRRQVATIGDIDIAVATTKPDDVIDTFVTYPHEKIIEQGPTGASLRLHNGRQVDLRVQKPSAYGAMLQYFTGSKNHNIALRSLALKKGMSLSEYGIKCRGKLTEYPTEESFYRALGLPYIAPELREDKGELTLPMPNLIELRDIKGDLHVHSDYNLSPSHDLGADPVETLVAKAAKLGYEYIGISDHNPSVTNHTESEIVAIMKRRKEYFEHKKLASGLPAGRRVHILLMCEIDILPNGTLALPDAAFAYIDAAIVSIHSSFTMERGAITKRIIAGLTANKKVRIFGHPTARLLSKREGIDADWPEVFAACRKHDIALEINAYPDRLDLPDSLVFDAKKQGLKFCINTDAHEAEHMDLMRYGVSVARRGWAVKHDIVNALDYNALRRWLCR